jgi:hypothetical protein
MKTDRELTINELDTVSGGADTCKTIAVCFNFTHFQPGGDGGGGGGDNDRPSLDHATQVRELRDDELKNVSGGSCCNGQHISEIVVTKTIRIPGATAPEGEVKF